MPLEPLEQNKIRCSPKALVHAARYKPATVLPKGDQGKCEGRCKMKNRLYRLGVSVFTLTMLVAVLGAPQKWG